MKAKKREKPIREQFIDGLNQLLPRLRGGDRKECLSLIRTLESRRPKKVRT